MRLEVAVERPDVAPVATVAVGGAGHLVVGEVVGVGAALRDEGRDDVAAHVVGAVLRGVGADRVHERVRREDVVAHRGVHLVGRVGQAAGVVGLLPEGGDPSAPVADLHDAELVGHADRLADRRNRAVGTGLEVLGDHVGEVHPVDVVGAHDDDEVRPLVDDRVEGLVDRVRAAEVPALAAALLRRDGCDVVPERRGQPPGLADVPVEAVRLVLGQHDDLGVAGVDDIAQREVHQAVDPPEGDRGLGPVCGQRHEPLALTSREDDREHLRLVATGHRRAPPSPLTTRTSLTHRTYCLRPTLDRCASTS